eukprot:CAMPEP_0174256266 /NCGR_PEP_ID=MMETSP0439-20130205/5520_1 /TAXON_ID=0 /ORGANISM="Stereomyxa ramosa, Strain Chinc5" /LENGTH=1755 /DNA_ID=CAMNT_0015338793 /DNA_START=1 /DNA_END=5268 /DNA_ORIENTATION=+
MKKSHSIRKSAGLTENKKASFSSFLKKSAETDKNKKLTKKRRKHRRNKKSNSFSFDKNTSNSMVVPCRTSVIKSSKDEEKTQRRKSGSQINYTSFKSMTSGSSVRGGESGGVPTRRTKPADFVPPINIPGSPKKKVNGTTVEKSENTELVFSTKLQKSPIFQLLQRMQDNDPTLEEITDSAVTIVPYLSLFEGEFAKMISDYLVFNTHLKILDLEGCDLGVEGAETLAEALKVNSTLKFLNLSYNYFGDSGLKHIAEALSVNEGLTSIDLQENHLTSASIDTLTSALQANLVLTNVNLSENTPLNLVNNKLIVRYENLGGGQEERRKKLDCLLEANQQFAKCVSGECFEADISHRQLEKPPALIFVVTTLRVLDLSHNRFTTIPRALRHLVRLEELNLSFNNLVGLPREFGHLSMLRVLQLQDNHVVQIPLPIILLDNLEEMYLANNKLRSLPVGLITLSSLRILDLRNNVSLPFPKDVIDDETGTKGIEYLRNQNNAQESCERIKLMCVGQANVGKTSLLDYLAKKFVMPSYAVSTTNILELGKEKKINIGKKAKDANLATDGIAIREWSAKEVRNERGEKKRRIITFSSWDFAGQEVYYYTHMFFLSTRGIYLIVFNLEQPEEENSRIQYWLQSIHTRARGAPVILVGTHLDNKKCTGKYLDNLYANLLQKYSSQFRNIRFFVALSCTTGKSVDILRKKLCEVAMSLITDEGKKPRSYLTLEEKLRALRAIREDKPIISYEEFAAMAVSSGIPRSPSQVGKAANYLHEQGTIVYFNERSSNLRQLVVINCQWLTNVFSDVITLKHNFVKKGFLKKKHLPQIWKPPNYPDNIHEFLVQLLNQFEVVYSLPPEEGVPYEEEVILVPCLLPVKNPDFENVWPTYPKPGIVSLQRFYEFEFVPFGFFNRMMVRLLRSGWKLEREMTWRGGMFYTAEEYNFKLLVHMKIGKKHLLKISLRGEDQNHTDPFIYQKIVEGSMLLILASIDTLVADWLNVNVTAIIPCIHCTSHRDSDPYMFNQSEIEHAVANGRTVCSCRGVDLVNIAALAPDVVVQELYVVDLQDFIFQADSKTFSTDDYSSHIATYKGETVLVNQLNDGKSGGVDSREYQEFSLKSWFLSGLNHGNIIKYIGFSEQPVAIVQEYDESMVSLRDYLRSHDIDWSFRLRIAADVAQAITYLHSITPPVFHSALTSENILLVRDEDSIAPNPMIAKIANFGLLEIFGTEKVPVWLPIGALNPKKRNNPYTADIYSFGALLWELITGEVYFEDVTSMSELVDRLSNNVRPPIPDCHEEYRELITECWSNSNRPSGRAIIKRIKKIAQNHSILAPVSRYKNLLPCPSVRNFSSGFDDSYDTTTYETTYDSDSEEEGFFTSSGRFVTENVAYCDEESVILDLEEEKGKEREDSEDSEDRAKKKIVKLGEAKTQNKDLFVTGINENFLPKLDLSRNKGKEMLERNNTLSKIEREYFNTASITSARHRQKIAFYQNQIAALQNECREAIRAKNRSDRNLAFQILTNDRQSRQLGILKSKMEKMKMELEMLKKNKQHPNIRAMHTTSANHKARAKSLPYFIPLGGMTEGPLLTPSTVRDSKSHDQLRALSTVRQRTQIKIGEHAVDHNVVDVKDIQDRLERRQVGTRILARLDYFDQLQKHPERFIYSPRPFISNPPTPVSTDETLDEDDQSPKETTKHYSLPRKNRGQTDHPKLADLDAFFGDRTSFSSLRKSAGDGTDSAPSGINTIFYGREQLIRLLLELDEFD